MSVLAFTNLNDLKHLLAYAKYVKEDTEVEREKFNEERAYFADKVQGRYYKKAFYKYMAQSLLNYYNEQIMKFTIQHKEPVDWEFSKQSHQILGLLLDKFTNDEIFPEHSNLIKVRNWFTNLTSIKEVHKNLKDLEIGSCQKLVEHLS